MPDTDHPTESATPPALSSIRFVLVQPEHPGNLGACARALKNMGFADLRVVGRRSLAQHPDAVRMSHGAEDLLGRITWAETLRQALTGCRWTLGTTRRVRKPRAVTHELRGFRDKVQQAPGQRPLAIVFGPEKDGLGFDDLALCQGTLTIPTSDAHPSLNLAQAVLLVAWELAPVAATASASPQEDQATHQELENMYEHLQGMLHDIGFVSPETARHQMLALRGLLSRSAPTQREITQLRGIWRQATWAAQQRQGKASAAPSDSPEE